MSKQHKLTIRSYIQALGILGAIRHFSRVARNRVNDLLINYPKQAYIFLGLLPAIAGIVFGILGFTTIYEEPWWAIFAKAGSAAVLVIGVVLSYAVLKVSPAYLGQITGLLVASARRLLFIGAVIGLAAYLGESALEQGLWLIALSAVLFATAPILYRTYKFSRWQAAHPLIQKKINWDDKAFSEEEIWRICVHEAGHAVAYGLWDRLPEDASAGINRDVEVHIGGYAWGAWATYAVEWTDDVADALLIQLCCGSLAEHLILGSQCYGNSDDIAEFAKILAKRCTHDFELGYRPEPASDFDRLHNARIEKKHRIKVLGVARELVEANQATIIRIANLLKEREFLDSMELHPIWQEIKLPAGRAKAPTPAQIPCLPIDLAAANT